MLSNRTQKEEEEQEERKEKKREMKINPMVYTNNY